MMAGGGGPGDEGKEPRGHDLDGMEVKAIGSRPGNFMNNKR